MKSDTPHILLVNPFIHDFAAYDFWAKPLGLLMLGAVLRDAGFQVSYIDCLDRFHPRAPDRTAPDRRCGRGPYQKTPIAKPASLADVPRRFSRYGILPEWLAEDLEALPRPDLILLGSTMTYWYPGVAETAEVVRSVAPEVPILLGGAYATLCPDHARRSVAADRVLTGTWLERIVDIAGEMTGWTADRAPDDPDDLPWPALDLQRKIAYAPLLTSLGCPFSCAYCASNLLAPLRFRRPVESVVEEVKSRHRDLGVVDFVFYDDALLVDADTHAVPLMTALIETRLPVRFHTPNALHIRAISDPVARLMKKAGFETVRLGLETATAGRSRLDRKVTVAEFFRSARALKRAGFEQDQVGAYLLAGLPGQTVEEVLDAVHLVKAAGIRPIPAYYSPIPGTALWPEAKRASRYRLEEDPVFTNNAAMPCWDAFCWETVTRIKTAAGG